MNKVFVEQPGYTGSVKYYNGVPQKMTCSVTLACNGISIIIFFLTCLCNKPVLQLALEAVGRGGNQSH